jgi:hypothetical protein
MSNFVVKDTSVSDSSLASVLTGPGVRELMLDASVSNVALPTLSSSTAVTLSTNQWIDATIRNLLLNSDTLTSVSPASLSVISLGSGVAQAAAYVNFFNLGSGESRFVRFGPVTTTGNANVALSAADGTAVGVSSGGIGGSVAGSGVLFNTGSSNVVRNVQVYCANPNASSARVIFNVL